MSSVSECCAGTRNIFSSGVGKLVLVDQDALPATFSVDGDPDTIADLNAIVTSVGIQGQGGFQFMHALREFIYVYVFTERIGTIVVSGLAFPLACDELPEGSQAICMPVGDTGVERVLTWYDCNRITTRARPIIIAFGADVSYQAFLTSVKVDLANPDTGVAQFSFHFHYVPHTVDNSDFCFPLDENCLEAPCGPQAAISNMEWLEQ